MIILKVLKWLFGLVVCFLLVIFAALVFIPESNPNDMKSNEGIMPFSLNNNDITYNSNNNKNNNDPNNKKVNPGIPDEQRKEVLERAKAMTEVKWIPSYNLIDKYGYYVFIKGKTYYGIPYSMDLYQTKSPQDFLNKIKGSNTLYGNDCSGFVSAAWGISRQTTLSLYNAVKNGTKIDGRTVCEIPWEDLRSGDALLIDNGKGKGHVMLYISTDNKKSDNINVYEQDIQTIIPFEPIPVARKDVRSKSTITKEGYIAIRLT